MALCQMVPQQLVHVQAAQVVGALHTPYDEIGLSGPALDERDVTGAASPVHDHPAFIPGGALTEPMVDGSRRRLIHDIYFWQPDPSANL